MNVPPLEPLRFVGSSLKDLKRFPADVQDEVGRALLDVQFGETLRAAAADYQQRGGTP
jgi:phage-related protein